MTVVRKNKYEIVICFLIFVHKIILIFRCIVLIVSMDKVLGMLISSMQISLVEPIL